VRLAKLFSSHHLPLNIPTYFPDKSPHVGKTAPHVYSYLGGEARNEENEEEVHQDK
jgi:hypothetical protein